MSKFRFVGGMVAVFAALTLFAGILAKSFTDKSLPPAHAQLSPSPNSPTATQAQAATQSRPAAPFPTDAGGFVNSAARCGSAQTALAVGRTQRSLVVICADQNGRYDYRGVRISNGALLKVMAETTSDGGFLARSEDVTYAVSPTQLLVTSGDTVINREPMIEYRQPHPFAASGAPKPHPQPTSTAPAPAR